MSTSNPFRRKQMQILGLDDTSYHSSFENLSSSRPQSPDVKSGQRSGSKKVRILPARSIHSTNSEEDQDNISKYSGSSQDNASDHSLSTHKSHEASDDGNPFDEDDEDTEADSLGELEDAVHRHGIRRRRTVPSKASQTLDVGHDNPWRTSTMIGNYPGSKGTRSGHSPDSTSVPLKAQKTLGISERGRVLSEEDYRRQNSLSPQTDNVAPKAQRMLGIPSNPFQKPQSFEDRQFYADELERHGARGSQSMVQRPLDVDEFKHLLLSGNRNSSVPDLPIQGSNRDSGSNTEVSSISQISALSRPDSRPETPRSSHEQRPRPHVTRIATSDSVVNPAAVLSEPFSNRPLTPERMTPEPQSATSDLNKPLPPPPAAKVDQNANEAYELAGSVPSPRVPPAPPLTRRYSQKVRQALERAGLPESIAELASPELRKAEPWKMGFASGPVLAELPGSESAPIELPAREASPVSAPRKKRAQNKSNLVPPAKSAPTPPPPRRGGSNRNSLTEQLGSSDIQSDLTKENKPPTSQPLTSSSDSNLPSSGGKSQAQLSRPPIPPARHSSTAAKRVHRYVPHSLPLSRTTDPSKNPALVPRPIVDSPTIKDMTTDQGSSFLVPLAYDPNSPLSASMHAPPPPPRRRGSDGGASRPTSFAAEKVRNPAFSPTFSPTASHGPSFKDVVSPMSTIPRLMTNISSGTPIADSMISAISPAGSLLNMGSLRGNYVNAPVSAISPTSPLQRRYSFGSITNNKEEKLNNEKSAHRGENRYRDGQTQEMTESGRGPGKIDVLADLGALQREVDALRGRFNNNGSDFNVSDPSIHSSAGSQTRDKDNDGGRERRVRDSRDVGEDRNNVIEQVIGSMNRASTFGPSSTAESERAGRGPLGKADTRIKAGGANFL